MCGYCGCTATPLGEAVELVYRLRQQCDSE
jgi:hypothetical protein